MGVRDSISNLIRRRTMKTDILDMYDNLKRDYDSLLKERSTNMVTLYVVEVSLESEDIIEQDLFRFCDDFNNDTGFATMSSNNVYIYLTREEAEEKLATLREEN